MTTEFKKNNLWIKIIAIIGVITSIQLSLIYYNANFVSNAAPSFCAINEMLDCDAVARTPYSLFLGIPLALYGLFFYLFVLFLAFCDKLTTLKPLGFLRVFKQPTSYIASLSLISVVISLTLACISHFAIHKICILCFFSYFLNIGIFALARQGKDYAQHIKTSVLDLIDGIKQPQYASLAILLAIIASTSLFYVNQTELFKPQSAMGIGLEAGKTYKDYKTAGNVLGNENGTVLLHEYTDYQCPYCSISNLLIQRLVSEVDNVMVIHHDFPLDSECNPMVKGEGHKKSCLYAQYGEASKLQNKFWEFSSEMFENNKDLSEAKVLKIAKDLHMNVEQLKKDAHDPALKSEVKNEVKEAVNLGVEATPTYRIGIKVHTGLMPYNELKEMVLESGGRLKE